MSTDDPITAEIVVTFPDGATLTRATLAAMAVAEGAALFRTTEAPWQLRVEQGALSSADWRERLVSLVEVLLPGQGLTPVAGHLDQIASLAERCSNLHAATRLPLRPEIHMEALVPALKEMAAQLRAIYVEVAGEDPWEDEPTEEPL